MADSTPDSTTPFLDTLPVEFGAPTPYVLACRIDWATVDALWGGTAAMRAAGKRFLPQEPLESDEDYARRLARTTLHNYYKRTVQTGAAKVAVKDPHFEPLVEKAPIPEEVIKFSEDVDTQGRNLGQFSKELFESGANHGIGFLLVDQTNGIGTYTNLAEERASGKRPHFIKISAEQLLDARSAKFGDGERLAFFKYLEEVTELSADLSSTKVIKQIRAFLQVPGTLGRPDSPVFWAVYRQREDDKWYRYSNGVVSTSHINIHPFYTNKIGFCLGRPPLMDLAELNIEHWQKKSDLNNILHVATVPILFLKGFKEELDKQTGQAKKIAFATNSALATSNKDADAKWIEHNGTAIGTAQKDIAELEARCESLGMTLTAIQHAGVSATANNINSADANSMLKSMALNLQDTLNAAMDSVCEFMGTDNTVRIVVNTEYAIEYTTNETMSDVQSMFEAGVISKAVVIAEAKRRNVLDNAAAIEAPPQNEYVPTPSATPPATAT